MKHHLQAEKWLVPAYPRQPASLLATIVCTAKMHRLFMRVDARRLASWISLLITMVGSYWLQSLAVNGSLSVGAGMMGAMLVGTLSTAAAIGDVPIGICQAYGGGGTTAAVIWVSERTAWPLTGILLAAAASGESTAVLLAAAMLLASLLTAVTITKSRLLGARAADAGSLSLMMASAAIAAGYSVGACHAGNAAHEQNAAFTVASAVWCALCLVAWLWSRVSESSPELAAGSAARGSYGVLRHNTLPTEGCLRRLLTGLSMGAALFGMVGWLFLSVNRAEFYCLLSVVLFICLAVPQATLLDGCATMTALKDLFRSAAKIRSTGLLQRLGLQRLGLQRLGLQRLGRPRFSYGVALSHAALLGWPPLVSAACMLQTQSRAWESAAIVVSVAAVATLLTIVTMLLPTALASEETAYAFMLLLVIVIALALPARVSWSPNGLFLTVSSLDQLQHRLRPPSMLPFSKTDRTQQTPYPPRLTSPARFV
ncbi:MAG: hypothetical protein DWH98_04400 [Planctomycetota bacterium]|nr:MAG: hypothetical protein DWH98_04400 [Planctomycetota bacterium]